MRRSLIDYKRADAEQDSLSILGVHVSDVLLALSILIYVDRVTSPYK